MNFYQRHLGDYARDTSHLSLTEHGAYTLLLDRYYATEAPIPEDVVYRVCHARTRWEREAVDTVLREFFSLDGGGWVNNRARFEMTRTSNLAAVARANGRLGGRPPKKPQRKPKQNPK